MVCTVAELYNVPRELAFDPGAESHSTAVLSLFLSWSFTCLSYLFRFLYTFCVLFLLPSLELLVFFFCLSDCLRRHSLLADEGWKKRTETVKTPAERATHFSWETFFPPLLFFLSLSSVIESSDFFSLYLIRESSTWIHSCLYQCSPAAQVWESALWEVIFIAT